ncbi:MAG TPA: PatB family C-S lyase [Anaeromyxobacter sp.]|nr:PatB family C-S lyase [Anaeromyxobacter sp.]
MGFDFDEVRERRGSDSVKWSRYAGRDVLPLWVADMDFPSPPAVIEALRRRIEHGIFGYASPWPSLVETVREYLFREHGLEIEPGWLVWLPGLVSGLNVACRAVPGVVFTAVPVYPPFLTAPARLVTAPLRRGEERWEWDLSAVEAALSPDVRLFLLCHPHNPVGRAFDEAELGALAELAARRDLVVCSDEIHAGLLLEPGRRHLPFAALSKEAARRSITLVAPSKTFNLPGLGCALAVIPDPDLRGRFRRAMAGIVPHVNVLGLVACEAALRDGGEWHRALIEYLRGNRERVAAAVAGIPGLRTTPVEATYLAWIDARGTGLPEPQRTLEEAGVGLSDGADFGPGEAYRGFLRLNFGCPQATLDEALSRMRRALEPR